MASVRLSPQTLAVLVAFLQAPDEWHYGYDLIRVTGTRAGTLYPILLRLADHGWLETRWEDRGEGGRPPRHLYRITQQGVRGATEMLARAHARRWVAGDLLPEGG